MNALSGPTGLVSNHFGILKLFRSRRFRAHWFESATPTFLVDVLLGRGVSGSDLDGFHASDALLSAFDVDAMATEALLFQTGYLTIRDALEPDGMPLYRLGYPNREVRQGLNRSLLDAMIPNSSREHRASGRSIHLVGVEFSREARNIAAFESERDVP